MDDKINQIDITILHRYPIVHYGLNEFINEKYSCELKGFTDKSDVEYQCKRSPPDLLFIQVPEFMSEAGNFMSMLPTICISDSADIDVLQDAVSLGASGFILISDPIEEYLVSIEMALMFGKLRIRSQEVKELIARLEEKRTIVTEAMGKLTSRDFDVLELLVQGKTNKQIAEELSLTHGTARNRVSLMLTKTDMPNRTALALWAAENEIVERS